MSINNSDVDQNEFNINNSSNSLENVNNGNSPIYSTTPTGDSSIPIPKANNNNNSNNNNNNYLADNNDSVNSALQHSNISSSTPHYEYSAKNSIDEIIHYNKPPSIRAILFRVLLSWMFGLVGQIILMLFNPSIPMQFIWGVLCVGCGMTAVFAYTWVSLLMKFQITFLITFCSMIYWIGTPIAWQILLLTKLYPPPIGVFTCIFPFEGISLFFLTFLIPKGIRSQIGYRKKVITAFSSLVAPYLSFVSGLIYFRLFQISNNTGRVLLPPVYTVIMKIIQLGLDIICIRCAHSGSNLLIILGRILASYYSFAVLSFIRNPVSVASVILSKLGLHIFMSLFMIFPVLETKIIALLPKSLINWKSEFEKATRDNVLKGDAPSATPDGVSSFAPGSINTLATVENEFDRMALENDPQFVKTHVKATNLMFSMFSDLIAVVMTFTVYTFGRYGPTNQHYNSMFPFYGETNTAFKDPYVLFMFYLAICFIALSALYTVMWLILRMIMKTLEFRKIVALVSVNWFPLHHFYVSCINFMMGYVIVVVALMPDLFSIPNIKFWNVGENQNS